MGSGEWGDEEVAEERTNAQFPIPNSQFPIPNSQFPISNSQFPIPPCKHIGSE
ncbi:MAG: hypothetical protein V7K98_25035 [Nostoc sp.]|uniref:hypothetical protein n=1 Tax=Nostoc sp. TaxID=1180 RepID=UPI002FF6F26B